MIRKSARRSRKAGMPPGSLVYLGEQPTEDVRIEVIEYSLSHISEREYSSWQEYVKHPDTEEQATVTWINVIGLHNTDIIEEIGATFDLHPLLLEDLVNVHQRPKLEDYGDKLFFVLRMLQHYEGKEDYRFTSEQVSLVVGTNYVLSFQERDGDVFDSLRQRIRLNRGKVRHMKADYLMYRLIDAIVDNYFQVLETFEDTLEQVEDELIIDPDPQVLTTIYRLRREMIYVRKSIWPLREALSLLERSENPILGIKTMPYFRDVYDHTIQIIDLIETTRDILSGMLDVYLNSVSNKMNEVMKTLTIIATIFIPLTFVAGIYGMNFAHMPELEWAYGYPTLLVIMGLIAAGLVAYFRLKRWL